MTKEQAIEKKFEKLLFLVKRLIGDLGATEAIPEWKRDLFYAELERIEK